VPRAASGDAVPESEGVGWCASGAFGPFGLKTGRDRRERRRPARGREQLQLKQGSWGGADHRWTCVRADERNVRSKGLESAAARRSGMRDRRLVEACMRTCRRHVQVQQAGEEARRWPRV
jgi:hypothetical protein